MQTVIDKLSDIFSAGFSAAGYDAALGRVVVSARPDLCQFQCNGAMSAAKHIAKLRWQSPMTWLRHCLPTMSSQPFPSSPRIYQHHRQRRTSSPVIWKK